MYKYLITFFLLSLSSAHAAETDRLSYLSVDEAGWVAVPGNLPAEDIAEGGLFMAPKIPCADNADPYLKPGGAGSRELFDSDLHQIVGAGRFIVQFKFFVCIRRQGALTGPVTLLPFLKNTITGEEWVAATGRQVAAGGPDTFATYTVHSALIQIGGRLILSTDRWAVGVKVSSGSSANAQKVALPGLYVSAEWLPAFATAPVIGAPWTTGGDPAIIHYPVTQANPAEQAVTDYLRSSRTNGGPWGSWNPTGINPAPGEFQLSVPCGSLREVRVAAVNERGQGPFSTYAPVNVPCL
jgi:hypothetical protein